MQLTREGTEANFIRAWESGAVRIGEQWIRGHVIVSQHRVVENWSVSTPEQLSIEQLLPALELDPEIIVLGTGTATVFPAQELYAALAQRRIGLEAMSTPAACRTFNVLMSEQRQVVVALFNSEPTA